MSSHLLETRELNVYYDRGHILHDISLHVDPEEAVLVLGLNGMGKTTLLRAIMGLDPPQAVGSILFEDREIINKKPNEIAQFGLGYVPQGRLLFPSLSVEEHLTLFYRAPIHRTGREWTPNSVYGLFPVLEERKRISGTLLSGGEQQMLAIARALVRNPRVLIMDEPAEGLAPVIVKLIIETCEELRETGVSMFLTEQNLEMAATLSDRALILETGRIVHESSGRDFESSSAYKSDLIGFLQI